MPRANDDFLVHFWNVYATADSGKANMEITSVTVPIMCCKDNASAVKIQVPIRVNSVTIEKGQQLIQFKGAKRGADIDVVQPVKVAKVGKAGKGGREGKAGKGGRKGKAPR